MIKKVLKKHFDNMIKENKIELLEEIKKEFIGVATYIDGNDFEYTINSFSKYDNIDVHIQNFNAILREIENKRNIAISINNLKYDELYLVVDYLCIEKIHDSLEDDYYEETELWELYASVSEILGYKVKRDTNGNCIEVRFN